MSLELLRRRICEADLWYRHWLAASTDPRDLRSRELMPESSRPFFNLPLSQRLPYVDQVCDRRGRLLESVGQHSMRSSRRPLGKLLLYDPGANLFCGAAEVETQLFFDVDNVAPADFWIGYMVEREPGEGFDSFLVSWIP